MNQLILHSTQKWSDWFSNIIQTYPMEQSVLKYRQGPPQGLGVAKSDTTRKPDTTNPFINRSWVEVKQVRIIFGLTWLTHLLNGSCSCSTCLTHLTRLTQLAYKINFTILPLYPIYISVDIGSSPQNQSPDLTPLSNLNLNLVSLRFHRQSLLSL